MSDFLRFFDEKRATYPIHMEIYYSKVMDWVIHVWKALGSGEIEEILYVQCCDMEYAFARAHVELKEWLLENEGGT